MKKILILAAFAAITFVTKAQSSTSTTTINIANESVNVVADDKPVKAEEKKEKKACCSKKETKSCDKKSEKSCDKDKKDGKKSCCSKKAEKAEPKTEEAKQFFKLLYHKKAQFEISNWAFLFLINIIVLELLLALHHL